MTPHPAETLLRELYAALVAHNLATLQLLVVPGVVCHLPGGEARGFESVFTRWLELTQRSANALELTLSEVLVGTHYAAALGDARLEGEHVFAGRLVCLVRLDGGRVAECWLHTDAPTQPNPVGEAEAPERPPLTALTPWTKL